VPPGTRFRGCRRLMLDRFRMAHKRCRAGPSLPRLFPPALALPFSTFSRLQHLAFYIPREHTIGVMSKFCRMASTLQEVRTITILADSILSQQCQEFVLKRYDDPHNVVEDLRGDSFAHAMRYKNSRAIYGGLSMELMERMYCSIAKDVSP
jgi:hypothetical protein